MINPLPKVLSCPQIGGWQLSCLYCPMVWLVPHPRWKWAGFVSFLALALAYQNASYWVVTTKTLLIALNYRMNKSTVRPIECSCSLNLHFYAPGLTLGLCQVSILQIERME